jgi:hypothetical protein
MYVDLDYDYSTILDPGQPGQPGKLTWVDAYYYHFFDGFSAGGTRAEQGSFNLKSREGKFASCGLSCGLHTRFICTAVLCAQVDPVYPVYPVCPSVPNIIIQIIQSHFVAYSTLALHSCCICSTCCTCCTCCTCILLCS